MVCSGSFSDLRVIMMCKRCEEDVIDDGGCATYGCKFRINTDDSYTFNQTLYSGHLLNRHVTYINTTDVMDKLRRTSVDSSGRCVDNGRLSIISASAISNMLKEYIGQDVYNFVHVKGVQDVLDNLWQIKVNTERKFDRKIPLGTLIANIKETVNQAKRQISIMVKRARSISTMTLQQKIDTVINEPDSKNALPERTVPGVKKVIKNIMESLGNNKKSVSDFLDKLITIKWCGSKLVEMVNKKYNGSVKYAVNDVNESKNIGNNRYITDVMHMTAFLCEFISLVTSPHKYILEALKHMLKTCQKNRQCDLWVMDLSYKDIDRMFIHKMKTFVSSVDFDHDYTSKLLADIESIEEVRMKNDMSSDKYFSQTFPDYIKYRDLYLGKTDEKDVSMEHNMFSGVWISRHSCSSPYLDPMRFYGRSGIKILDLDVNNSMRVLSDVFANMPPCKTKDVLEGVFDPGSIRVDKSIDYKGIQRGILGKMLEVCELSGFEVISLEKCLEMVKKYNLLILFGQKPIEKDYITWDHVKYIF